MAVDKHWRDGTMPERVGVAVLAGREHLLAAWGDRVVSLTDALDGVGSTVDLISRWEELAPTLAGLAKSAAEIDSGAAEWRAPVMPRKLICVGANYHDHLVEMERAGAPKIGKTPFPFTFLKPPSTALVGSGVEVAIPGFGEKLDWEAELAVVIGRPQLAAEEPLSAIFGYAVLNELSLRDFVAPFPHPLGLDAVISKGWDGSAPMGPWLTLAAAAGDPATMPIELRVNGEVKQQSSTEQMIFDVADLVSYYDRVLTLEPGDVIATGTPAGVGAGMQPPQFLAPGDEVEVEIGDLGVLRTPIVAAREPRSLSIH